MYNDLLTKRYAPRGRGPDAFDCWGLCEEVARLAGRQMLSFSGWVAATGRAAVVERMAAEHFRRLDGPAPYCIVLFRVPVKTDPSKYCYHIGTVLADSRRFIHARSTVGIAITRLEDYRRPVGFYEYVG